MEAPTDADSPSIIGAQRPTDREMAAVNLPLVARTAVNLPKIPGATQLDLFLAQFRLAEWHNGLGAGEAVVHLALALEGTAVQVMLDLAPADQRDLRVLALIRALEMRFGQRAVLNHSRGLLNSCRRRRLGAYAADIQLYARRGYPNFPAAARDELALHAFLQGLAIPWLGQHVRLNMPPTLDVALDVAEQAERELSDQPGLQSSTEDACQD